MTGESVVVVAPPEVAAGFALAGADTVSGSGPGQVEEAARRAGVVLVHHEVWQRLPVAVRDGWAARNDVLVLGLPPDDRSVGTEHQTALQRLLARAVGYEISFVPEGTT